MRTMKETAGSFLMAANMLFALNASARPQDLDTGQAEFLANCAVCHGADGKGAGPLSAKLDARPADLTLLAKNNNGVFSPDAVYRMIDGRQGIRKHRSIDMPIWGCRHQGPPAWRRTVRGKSRWWRRAAPRVTWKRVQAPTIESLLDLPCDPEPVIEQRIQSIVEYLSRIQKK